MNWLKNIWQFERWAIKLALFVAFVLVTGLPQLIVNHFVEERAKKPVDERQVRALHVDPMMFEIVRQAEERIAKGQTYSPDEYFEDLKRYKEKCYELRISEGGNAEINRLQWLMQKGLTEKKFTHWDVDRAAKAYRYYIEEGSMFRKELAHDTRSFSWRMILLWLIRLYLKLLPLVFILYMVWAKDEAAYKKFLMPRPLRFLVLWILYPFVIGYYAWQGIRESERRISAEAELRRTRRLFAYVTEAEQERIEQFAKSNLTLADWRKHLADLGLKPRHSFAAALLVTLLFVIVMRPAEACAKQTKNFTGNTSLEEIASSQNLARASIGQDAHEKIQTDGQGGKNFWTGGADMIAAAVRIENPLVAFRLKFREATVPIAEFFRKIFHIPLPVVQFEVRLAVHTQI